MNPKEKAIDLVEKFSNIRIPNVRVRYRVAVENALIAVNEILDLGLLITDSNKLFVNCDESQCLSYWLQVKIELEKL